MPDYCFITVERQEKIKAAARALNRLDAQDQELAIDLAALWTKDETDLLAADIYKEIFKENTKTKKQ